MKKSKKSAVALASGLVGMVLIAGSSFAIEPVDNTSPTGSLNFAGNATVYECGVSPGCAFSTSDRISTATDQDFIVVTCGNTKVTQVGITIQNSPFIGAGDLDIDVLRPTGALVGSSHGVVQHESVNTTGANTNSLVLRVFGFNGGQNNYQVDFSCN
jgi:hypothetical protein